MKNKKCFSVSFSMTLFIALLLYFSSSTINSNRVFQKNLNINDSVVLSKNQKTQTNKTNKTLEKTSFIEKASKLKDSSLNNSKNLTKIKLNPDNNYSKILHQGWLRKANINEFIKLKTLSDQERENVNPFDENTDYKDSNLNIPVKNLYYFELSKSQLLIFNTKNISRKVIKNIKIESVNLLSKVSKIFKLYFYKCVSLTLLQDFPSDYVKLCFEVSTKNADGISKHKEILCAGDFLDRNIWYCKVKKTLDQYCDLDQPNKVIKQPIIIIPTPTPFCNEKWNYQNNGKDWECSCKEGIKQSPIDLPNVNSEKAVLNAERTLFEFFNLDMSKDENKKDVKIIYEDFKIKITGHFGRLITPELVKYDAESIEFHTGSEHKINGKYYDLEAQINYSSTLYPGKRAILSLLFQLEPGVKNRFFDFDIDVVDLPSNHETVKSVKSDMISVIDFFAYTSAEHLKSNNHDSNSNPYLNAYVDGKLIDFNYFKYGYYPSNTVDFNYYSYEGSLTSPPCQEEVTWFIADKPLPIGYTTLEYFKDVMKISELNEDDSCVDTIELMDNKRELQKLNDREVYYYNSDVDSGRNLYLSKESNNNSNNFLDNKNKNHNKTNNKQDGHFEKVKGVVTKYFYVNSDETSSIPGAVAVTPEEAGVISFSKNKIKIVK